MKFFKYNRENRCGCSLYTALHQVGTPLLRSAITNFAKTILSKDQGKEEAKALGFATLLTLLNCLLGGQGVEREMRQLFAFSHSSPATEGTRDLEEEVC